MSQYMHRAWYEKYRPGSLKDLQLPSWMMNKFDHYCNHPENTPNLLFVGKPGSGKTTLAEILIAKWCENENDVLRINGSGVSIDDIRLDPKDSNKGKIYQFASAPPISSPFRIVYMEELQKANAQDFYKYFRQVIELLNTNTIFMISTNSIAELDKPFVQRFQTYTFNALPKDHVEKYIHNVLEHENVQYNDKDVSYIINYFYPSVREMLQVLQQFTDEKSKVLTLDYDLISFNSELIQDLLNIISTSNINSNEFNNFVGKIKANSALIDVRYIISQILYSLDPYQMLMVSKNLTKLSSSVDPDIALLALLGEILIKK